MPRTISLNTMPSGTYSKSTVSRTACLALGPPVCGCWAKIAEIKSSKIINKIIVQLRVPVATTFEEGLHRLPEVEIWISGASAG